MVGDGVERSYCEQLARDLNVANDIRFLGKQDAIEEILSVSDLFLMPSQSESFGLAALEAMACKVPVISSNGRRVTRAECGRDNRFFEGCWRR